MSLTLSFTPKAGDEIELWRVEPMQISGWFVRESVKVVVFHSEIRSDGLLLIRATTPLGIAYECVRQPRPTLEQFLTAAAWHEVSTVVSLKPKMDADIIPLRESVLAYNHYQALVASGAVSAPANGLCFPGSAYPTARLAVPRGDVVRCQTHYRYSYTGNKCPVCHEEQFEDKHRECIPCQAVA